jgi:protein translocase SecG subunit
MSFFIMLLTFFLVVNCAVLVLLILVQQPKKDSGAGLAFGGGAADALFGAGSGNALTKITKWATGSFVVLALILGALQVKMVNGNQSAFQNAVEAQQQQMKTPQITAPTPNSGQQQPAAPGAAPSSSLPLFSSTNAAPGAPVTTTNGK